MKMVHLIFDKIRRRGGPIGKRVGQHSAKPRIHFLHIGKTGGTALRFVLDNWQPERYEVIFCSHAVKLSDVPSGDKFAFFVRNPISRFVSGFYSRQRKGQPRYHYPWSPAEEDAFQRFSSPSELALALSDPDVKIREAARNAMESVQHVRDRYHMWFGSLEYFSTRIEDLFFVGSQERMESDFERLKSVLGLPRDARLPLDDKEAHRSPVKRIPEMPVEALCNLKEWYKSDYTFLEMLSDRYDHLPRYEPVDHNIKN